MKAVRNNPDAYNVAPRKKMTAVLEKPDACPDASNGVLRKIW
jgi:hypothetical protein